MLELLAGAYDFLRISGNWRIIAQDSLTIVLLVSALIWCAKPEKFVISIWVIVNQAHAYLRNYIASTGQQSADLWTGVNLNGLASDTLLLIGFVTLALLANRQYLLWIAALQVIAILGHVVRATNDELSIFAYAFIVIGAGWLQLLVMAGGQIAYLRRKRGVYADWYWQVARPMAARPLS